LVLTVLCFTYLTLPNFAGKLLKALSKDGKTSNKVQQGKNRQNHMFARLPSSPTRHGELTKGKIGREACLLATSSPPTRHGELPKEKIGRSIVLLAMASEVTWEASKGGLTSPG